jgi:hypothetical protein
MALGGNMTVEGDQEQPWADWYIDGSAQVEQGDILLDFPVVTPVGLDSNGDYTFARRKQTVVLLTQTCDVQKAKQRTLMAASVHDYDALVATGDFQYLTDKDYKKSLARGSAIADFLLPPTAADELSWSIAHFREIFVLPKAAVQGAVERQAPIRLASPYKEFLSQAFARFVMRVGLPSPLTEFERRR